MKNSLAPFTQRQSDYLSRVGKSWFNVAEGGKRGGKNVLQTFAFCLALEKHPNRIHLIAGFSVAAARLNIMDCDGYGLLNFFEGRCREGVYQNRKCLYIRTIAGSEKIILVSGGGKAGDEKLIKGNSYGMAYITEANECTSVFIKEVFDRTIASQERMIFHDLNPKPEGHWYYKDVLNFHEVRQKADPEYGYNFGHFTVTDNMSISDEKLKKILSTYDTRSVWYQREILGLRKQAEGVIYDMFSPDIHIYPNAEVGTAPTAGRGYVAVDYGTVNPMVYLDIWDSEHAVYIRREYYYASQDSENGGKQKTDQQYGDDFEEFCGTMYPDFTITDPSAASFKTELTRRRYRVKDADNAVLDGIRMVASLFAQKKIYIHESCVNTIREIGSYVWDEKAKQRGEEKPLKVDDHCMDALRYFCKTMIKRWRL